MKHCYFIYLAPFFLIGCIQKGKNRKNDELRYVNVDSLYNNTKTVLAYNDSQSIQLNSYSYEVTDLMPTGEGYNSTNDSPQIKYYKENGDTLNFDFYCMMKVYESFDLSIKNRGDSIVYIITEMNNELPSGVEVFKFNCSLINRTGNKIKIYLGEEDEWFE